MTIDFTTPDNSDYTFSIYNTLGQLIFTEEVSVQPFGSNRHTIDFKNSVANGVYFLTIENVDDINTVPFVVACCSL